MTLIICLAVMSVAEVDLEGKHHAALRAIFPWSPNKGRLLLRGRGLLLPVQKAQGILEFQSHLFKGPISGLKVLHFSLLAS